MDIKTDAPAIARAHVQVAADPQAVWAVISDLEGWPSWNEEISSMSLHGPLAAGSAFEWKAGPGTIRSRLGEVDPPRKIAWSGVTFGIKAIDVFHLEARDGGTFVTEEESWDGLLVRLLSGRTQRTLQASIETRLRSLKAEAERRAAASHPAA